MKRRRGFTLVEMLGMVGLVLVLTALLIEVGSWGRKKSLVTLTTSELTNMKLAVQKYCETTRQLPPDGIEGLTGALLPMNLYPFAETRIAVPENIQAEKARLQEHLTDLEGRIADAEKRLADLQNPGGGPDAPPPVDPELARLRDEVVATAVLHIRGAAKGTDLDHPSLQDLLRDQKQLLREQAKRGLDPAEAQELTDVDSRIAEYRRDIQEAMRLTGLDDPDLATRFRNTVGRSDHLTFRYGAELCKDPEIAFGAVMHVAEQGERAKFYQVRFAETHNREITEEMILEVLDVIRRSRVEWEDRHGTEPWELRENMDWIIGCIKKSVPMVYNGVNPTFDRIWIEKSFTDYVKEETIEEIRRVYDETGETTLQEVIKTREDMTEYDPWRDVGGPCIRQLLENRTYEVKDEYLFDRKSFELRYDDPPYPGGNPGDGGDPSGYPAPDPRKAIEDELAGLREAYLRTQDILSGLDARRTYVDAWGNAFVYEEVRATGIREGVQADPGEPFVVYSAGPDGRYHTTDDVRAQ